MSLKIQFNLKMVELLMEELSKLELSEESELFRFWEELSKWYDSNPDREKRMRTVKEVRMDNEFVPLRAE